MVASRHTLTAAQYRNYPSAPREGLLWRRARKVL